MSSGCMRSLGLPRRFSVSLQGPQRGRRLADEDGRDDDRASCRARRRV